MSSKELTLFLDSIRTQKLGQIVEWEISELQGARNVGEFARKVAFLIRVSQKSDLVKIVEEANRWGTPIYPYSRGFNWGYGSHLPVRNGGVLLDLSALNRIFSIDEEQGIATIEPGVTQRQLSEELARRSSRYYLDVTGSGADTSILGNAIERGIAYGSLRVQQLSGMEILLGNGTQFHTGFGGFPNPALSGLYSYGLGPDLQGLFFQSNVGIVLEGKLQLALRPECMLSLSVAITECRLSAFVDKVADLVRKEYLHGIPHIANCERTASTLTPLVADKTGRDLIEARKLVNRIIRDDWMLTTAVTGSPDVVRAKLKHIKKNLRSLGTIYSHALIQPSRKDQMKSWLINRLMTSEQKILVESAKNLRGFHLGVPSDAGIRFLLNTPGKSVDEGSEGFLLCTPLAPLSGKNAQFFSQVAHEQAKKNKVRFAMTLNVLTGRVLEAVISVHFSRASQEDRDRAHACINGMTEVFCSQGFYPYRINIDQQEKFASISPMQEKISGSIKRALDPNAVLAPGRYGP
jgi:4-cresol dehydrogenase (hydroxylating)